MHETNFSKQEIEEAVSKLRHEHIQRAEIFLTLPHEMRAHVVLRLSRFVLHDLISKIPDSAVVETLEELDPDEATDILQHLHRSRRAKLTTMLSERLKDDVEALLAFEPDSAAGLMNLDYIQVDENETIEEVAKKFKTHEKRTGRMPTILAMREGKLCGFLPGHELGFSTPNDVAKKFIRKISTVSYSADQKEVIELFKNHPHTKVAVIGDHEQVLGIIYSDDILRVLEEQESASLYDFAGVHREETVLDSTKAKVRSRYKWLIINLGTAFLAAFTVGLFNETISKYVLLAVYMPIVAGMGGNAATQTLAVLVRGIALRQISLKTAMPTLKRELGAGLIHGLINGVIVAAVVMLLNKDLKIALILGFAMIVNLLVAATFGTIVPLIMKKLGKDPATSATIFITTATDVLGFMAFLGLATIVLH